MKEELIKALEEYISFLGEELDELAVLASIHGWKSKRHVEGVRRRQHINELKSKINGKS